MQKMGFIYSGNTPVGSFELRKDSYVINWYDPNVSCRDTYFLISSLMKDHIAEVANVYI